MSFTPEILPNILYEDNHLIAINKPPGILSQADGSSAPDVLTIVKAFIKQRDQKPGNVFLGLVQRLDRPVSGAMILAKTSKAASRLSRAFRERTVEKTYRAVVEGDAADAHKRDNGKLVHLLQRDAQTRVSKITAAGGKQARLSWRILDAASHRSWIEIALETGLPHQIRVQFSNIGHPIIGDRKYGARQTILNHKGVIALYCHQLQISHPTRNEPLVITAPPPVFWGTL